MKMRNTIFILLFSFIAATNTSGQFWLQTGGSTTIDEALAVASDGDNNVYTTGYFTNILSLNSVQVSTQGLEDIFISKMDSNGYLKWLKRAGGSGQERALAIDADASGNIVIAGYYYGTTTFGATTLTSQGQQDIFIARYDSSGTLVWAKSAGGAGSDICNAVKFDNSGNIIIAGEFSDTCYFDANSLISQNNSIDVFIAKYDASGNVVWTKKGSGAFTDRAVSLDTDPSGNIYACGLFSDTIAFTNSYPNNMQNAVFLIKLTPSGTETWFRWIGSAANVQAGGVSYSHNGINITGSFAGSLIFFGVPGNPVMNPVHSDNIFVARYNSAGSLMFNTSNGSEDSFTATAIGTGVNGDIFITGNFACRLTDYSDIYGDGVFRSVGFQDTYVASYDSTGSWLWARQYGGRQNDFAFDLEVYKDSIPVIVGSYKDKLFVPVRTNTFFTPHGTVITDYNIWTTNTSLNCSDPHYKLYIETYSKGNSDLFINAAVDKNRQTFDFYNRNSSLNSCTRDVLLPCIRNNGQCVDSLFTCSAVVLSFDPGGGTGNVFNEFIKPDFSVLWNNGSTTGIMFTSMPGIHSVSMTSADGCYSFSDSMSLTSSFQVPPTITDSKGFNINNPMPVDIELCTGDSATLWCTNQGNSTLQWDGYAAGVNPIMVDSAGSYSCTLTNSFGCSVTATVNVYYVDTLQNVPITPSLYCFEDSNHDDTLTVCQYATFHVLLYDQITNPGANQSLCIPNLSSADWELDPISISAFNYTSTTTCQTIVNEFVAGIAGTYDLIIDVDVVRANACGTDTVSFTYNLHVIVNPVDNSPITVSITGNNTLCPGDTIILTANPVGPFFTWNTGTTGNTLYVTQPGNYSVSGALNNTNAFGCFESHSGFDTATVAQYIEPVLTTTPSSGIICPNDSVLITSNTPGTTQWFGPSGSLPGSNNFIYSSLPGNYYCIQEPGPGCFLLSNTISLSQATTPALFAVPDSACPGEPITLNLFTSPGSVIQWLPPVSGSATSVTVFSPGVYQCDVFSCGTTVTVSASANYYPSPSLPVISYNFPDLMSTAASTYQWFQNGNIISGANMQSFTPTSPGNYTVLITDGNGCTALSDPFLITGLNENTLSYGYSIYPNPASAEITFTYFDKSISGRSFTIIIRDLNGKALKSLLTQSGKSFFINDLSSGYYLIDIFDQDVFIRTRFVKL